MRKNALPFTQYTMDKPGRYSVELRGKEIITTETEEIAKLVLKAVRRALKIELDNIRKIKEANKKVNEKEIKQFMEMVAKKIFEQNDEE